MEKEHQPDSMATVTMKPEYPPSEVYSTAEPPPAYRRPTSTSVQIARIAALTVVAASFILGAFILASSWVSARASCHQLEQLDAMLDKELALEGRAYGNDALMSDEPLPVANAHALHAAPPQPSLQPPAAPSEAPAALPVPAAHTKDDALNQAESKVNEDKLQKIDGDDSKESESGSESGEDSSAEDDDDELRPLFRMPVQFDLDDLAGAFLANNQKGRMNCVVERRHDEPLERRFPFNLLGAFAPRSSQAERIAIICHGGDEPRPMNFPDPASQVFAFPLSGPARLPLRPQLEARAPAPETRPPPPPPPFAPIANQRPAPFPLPMPWEQSEESMGGPREMRIHVQRVIAIPAPRRMSAEPLGPYPPPPPPSREQNDESAVVHQFVPQPAPTQEMEQSEGPKMQAEVSPMQAMPMNLPWGLTPEDLQAIHRTAEEAAASQQREQQIDNDMQEVKTIVNTLAAAAEAEAAEEQRRQGAGAGADAEQESGEGAAVSARAPRTLLLPQEMPMEERPHYLQPRSVRSVDGLLHREKRVKRCACNCA